MCLSGAKVFTQCAHGGVVGRRQCEGFHAVRSIVRCASTDEIEVWRRLTITGCATRYELRPRDALISIVQEMLWALTPGDHQGACAEARTLVVADVEQVENVNVWKRYCVKKEELSSSLRRRRELDRRDPQSALRPLKELHGYLDYITLRKDVNDVLLLYGTSSASAKNIVLQGFDDRLVGRQLYGHGVYFTLDACKVLQYCSEGGGGRCLFVAFPHLGL